MLCSASKSDASVRPSSEVFWFDAGADAGKNITTAFSLKVIIVLKMCTDFVYLHITSAHYSVV